MINRSACGCNQHPQANHRKDNFRMTAYIYLIRQNGFPCYVGYTRRTIKTRWKQHLQCGKANKGGCIALNDAMHKHGVEAFTIEPLFESDDTEYTLNIMEPKLIAEWNTFVDCGLGGYNLTTGGGSTKSVSDITKQRMSETRKKLMREHPRSEETINKWRESRKGYIPTEETRKKHSISGKASSNRGRFQKGNIVSVEVRKIVSETHKGKVVSEETRKRMSDGAKKRGISDETRKKIAESLRGKVLSEETRKKMSESHKKRFRT